VNRSQICDVVLDTDALVSYSSNMNNARKYPSYTLAQLEAFVAAGNGSPVMVQEIADRKSGASVVRTTPQILGGIVIPRIGRM
jgi:hypothetical protein